MVDKSVTLNTGRSMPTIGFGVYGLSPTSTAEAVVNALQVGYRHVDTARFYGNEAEVGQGVLKSGLPREQVFITSKVMSNGVGHEETVKSVEESVEKLGLGYFDLYLDHSPHGGSETRLKRYKALLEARKRGLARTVGVSNYSEKHISEIEEAGLEMPAVNQIELHPWCQQRSIVSYCDSKGIVVQAYSPLLRGNQVVEGRGLKNVVVRTVAEKHNKTAAQILIRWSLQKGYVPLPKATSVHRMEENIKVYDFALDAEDMAAIDALDEGDEGAVTWNPVGQP